MELKEVSGEEANINHIYAWYGQSESRGEVVPLTAAHLVVLGRQKFVDSHSDNLQCFVCHLLGHVGVLKLTEANEEEGRGEEGGEEEL